MEAGPLGLADNEGYTAPCENFLNKNARLTRFISNGSPAGVILVANDRCQSRLHMLTFVDLIPGRRHKVIFHFAAR